MKKLISLSILVGLMFCLSAQAPEGFSYQAVIRDVEGQPLTNQVISVRLTLQNAEGTIDYYAEVHSITTSPHGVISLTVGSGTNVMGNLSNIQWEIGGFNLKVEVDPAGGESFNLLGSSPLLAVPYALYALSGNEGPQGPQGDAGPQGPEGPLVAGTDGQTLRHDGTTWVASSNIHNADANVGIGTITPTEKLEVAGNIKAQGRLIGQAVEVNQPQPEEEPIFVVRNSAGKIVFAVYEGGVRAYVDDTGKQTRGGFAVGGLSDQTKEQEGVHYFSLAPDSVRFNIKIPTVKQTRGGFAVGGLSDQTKESESQDLLFIAPDSARIYVDSHNSKQTRGGFAVGGLSDQTKSKSDNFLFLTPLNSFIGQEAGKSSTIGQNNAFLGYQAGYTNTIGDNNTFIGNQSGFSNIDGDNNVFIGTASGKRNTSGFRNIFIGTGSGENNTSGFQNITIGDQAGFNLEMGNRNIYIGTSAGEANMNGYGNVIIGNYAGNSSTSHRNVYIGRASGLLNTTGVGNVFLGESSGVNNKEGSSNVFIGRGAGANNFEGSGNVFIGKDAGLNEQGSNRLYISNSSTSEPLIYGDFENGLVDVNGSLKLSNLLQLTPITTYPGDPEEGDVFYDQTSHSLKYFNGTKWMQLSAIESNSAPLVSIESIPAISVLENSCIVKCNISDQGSSPVIQSGVYYNSTPFFNVESAIIVEDPSPEVGSYEIIIEWLQANTTYYLRAFATNSDGIALSNMSTFKTEYYGALPLVNTNPVLNISQNTAKAGGSVAKPGGSELTDMGICWGTSSNPTLDDNYYSFAPAIDTFEYTITGLSTETAYYVRAYAVNGYGIAYGNEVAFKTTSEVTTVNDIDGNTYNTVQIGLQTWLKENLKVTRYNDGSEIPNVTDTEEWSAVVTGAYCWYDNDEALYKNVYGALYNFYVVSDTRGVCPVGWHVPDNDEWQALSDYLGGNEIAGGKLKEAGTEHWYDNTVDTDNSSDFTALPGGVKGFWGFDGIYSHGYWWSESEIDSEEEIGGVVFLRYDSNKFYLSSARKDYGNSIRCIKD